MMGRLNMKSKTSIYFFPMMIENQATHCARIKHPVLEGFAESECSCIVHR
jgi:hypothetical protein